MAARAAAASALVANMPRWIRLVHADLRTPRSRSGDVGRVVDADDPGRGTRRPGSARTCVPFGRNLVSVLLAVLRVAARLGLATRVAAAALLVSAAGAVARLMVGKPVPPARGATDVVFRELGFASRGRLTAGSPSLCAPSLCPCRRARAPPGSAPAVLASARGRRSRRAAA